MKELLIEKYHEVSMYIRERGDAKVSELCERFYLSEATVRRVLRALAEKGVVRRYYGGAALMDPESLTPIRRRQVTNGSEKQAIGRLAASLVRDGSTLIMLGGTTVSAMCPYLISKKLTVITNSLPVVNCLSWHAGIQLVLLGGVLNPPEMEMRGTLAEQGMKRLRANQLFMGTTGIHPAQGVMTDDPNAVGLYAQCIRTAEETYVLADHTKLHNPTGTICVGMLGEISGIITDGKALDPVLRKFKDRTNLLKVEVASPVNDDTNLISANGKK